MARALNLFFCACDGLLASPGRSIAILAAVAFGLFLPVSGLAISEGLRSQARDVLEGSADIFVSADAFGAEAPVPESHAEELAAAPGVLAAVPRVIGRVLVGSEWIVVVGIGQGAQQTLSPERQPAVLQSGQALVGEGLASRLGWSPPKRLMLEAQRTLVVEAIDAFESGSGMGAANTIVLTLDDAQTLFERDGEVTDILVYCRPGYRQELATRFSKNSQYRIQTQDLVARYIDASYTKRAGALLLCFAVAIAILIPLVILIADLGMEARKREYALMKTCGWGTYDLVGVSMLENALLALLASASSLGLAMLWVLALDAPLIRSVFLPGSWPTGTGSQIPAIFSGIPTVLGASLCFAVTTVGGLWSVFRATTRPPSVVLRR